MAVHVIIIVLILLVPVGLFFAGAWLNARYRARTGERVTQRATTADRDLAAAAAQDRGWDRAVMEAAVRDAWARRPDAAEITDITLARVIDRPGTDDDRADFLVSSAGGQTLVVLARSGDTWSEAHPSGSAPVEA